MIKRERVQKKNISQGGELNKEKEKKKKKKKKIKKRKKK